VQATSLFGEIIVVPQEGGTDVITAKLDDTGSMHTGLATGGDSGNQPPTAQHQSGMGSNVR
jgi:hypothetical protein